MFSFKILYEATVSRLAQSPVTLSSPFGPLFSTCRAGGLGGGRWGWVEAGDFLLLQCLQTVLKSHCSQSQTWKNGSAL